MPVNFRQRSLLSLADATSEEIALLLDLAAESKRLKRLGTFPRRLVGKNVALIFLKPSARTRFAFLVASADEGAQAHVFGPDELRFGVKESVKDLARVMGRMFDGIMFRGSAHHVVQELALHAGVPVWNGLCDDYHPTQVLADLMTVAESFGSLRGTSVVYVGDGRNNQANTLLIGAAKLGLDLRILAPRELQPERERVAAVEHWARASGARITISSRPQEALPGAAVVYGDVWVSMGEEHLLAERLKLLRTYRVTNELMRMTGRSDTIYLHCLPAFHDGSTVIEREHEGIQEVSDEVFEGPQSRVFDQAENRMHTAKALMVSSIGS